MLDEVAVDVDEVLLEVPPVLVISDRIVEIKLAVVVVPDEVLVSLVALLSVVEDCETVSADVTVAGSEPTPSKPATPPCLFFIIRVA